MIGLHFNRIRTGYNATESILKPSLYTLWERQITPNSFVVSGNRMYVTSSDGNLYALDLSGQTIWQTPAIGGALAVKDGVVYSSNCNPTCYATAYDANTGQQLWTSADPIHGGVVGINVVDNRIFIGSNDHALRAIDATDGHTLWVTGLPDGTPSSPAVSNGIVFIGSYQSGGIYALDVTNGNILWNNFYAYVGFVSPSATNGIVYMGSASNGGVTAFNASTGQQKWFNSLSVGGFQQTVQTPVAVANGIAYVRPDNGRVYALDANFGGTKWVYLPTKRGNANNIAVANGVIYFGEDNDIVALDALTGSQLWRSTMGAQIYNVAVADGKLFFITQDGKLHAFSEQYTFGAITAPTDPVRVNSSINASATYTYKDVSGTHTATWNWGDGTTSQGTVTESNGSGSIIGSHTYAQAGIYSVTVSLSDGNGGNATSAPFNYIVVYDQSAGWVAGSKEYNSPAGAVTSDPNITGTATFGFQVKYSSGAMVPSGKNVSFDFPAANISFTSTSYQWLVMNGSKATFKANGALNGISGHTILISAIDNGSGNPTGLVRFQIKDSNNSVVYETQPGAPDTADPGTAVTRGQIAVH